MKKITAILIFLLFFLGNEISAQNSKYDQEIQLQTDNDILTFKRRVADRYYSFGEHLDYRKLINNESKLFRFVEKYKPNLEKVIVNWHVGIEAYTSDKHRDKKMDGIFVSFDRPYAGWLFAENRITAVNQKSITYFSLTVGTLGPTSGAEKLQDNFHNLINNAKFEEWDNQIQNEIAANIGAGYNIPIFKSKLFEFHSQTSVSLGTQATYFKQGFIGRFGKFNPINNTVFYNTNLTHDNTPPKSEFFIDFGAHLVTWGYKATIQGRFFGENVNMNTDGLHRVNVDASTTLNFSKKRFSAFFRQHLITAETVRGRHFYYGSLGITFKM